MRKADDVYLIDSACSRCGKPLVLNCGLDRPAGIVLSLSRSVICEDCEKTDAERAAEHEREQAFELRLLSSGLRTGGRGFGDLNERTPEGEDRRPAIAAARDWGRMADPGGLCLLGATGCGKTALAKAAALERLRHAPLRWVSLATLVAELSNFEDRVGRANAVKVLTGKGALVLDDFDKVSISDWIAAQLFAAIDGRIERGAPLLITTNLSAEELRSKFGDAIYSRIEGYCRMVELPGPDYRLVNRAAAA